MENVTCGTALSFFQKIGWNWLSVAFSLLIVVIAAVTLSQLVRDVEIERVFAALNMLRFAQVLFAGGFIAASYFTLTLYDYFALRAIGRGDVPYRIAALGSFTSYTVGHNLGATVLTGGLIRFRIYSAWGLSVIDVAKLAFITGLTFWLGNVFMLGIGMSLAPEAAAAVNRLPSWINRAIGLAGLAVIGSYLLWLMPRSRVIGRSNWRIVLPNLRLTLVQIAIGVMDLGLAGLAMYALIPSAPAVDFVTLLVIFVNATLLGFLSHAPGSLGVIEAAMLIGLPQFQKDELLASLLMFRFLYFVVPLFIAAFVLSARELAISAKLRTQRRKSAERTSDAA